MSKEVETEIGKLTSIRFGGPLHWRSFRISVVGLRSENGVDHAELLAEVGDGRAWQQHIDHVHRVDQLRT